jgi:hypothetical protein
MNTTGNQLAVGLRYGVAFALNAAGRPAATGATAYTGVEFAGAKAFTLNVPEPRRIAHVGDDRVLAVDYLPPTEPVTGEIRTARGSLELDALLSGAKVGALGEASYLARASDRQGSEPQVGLLLYQQSLEAASRLRRWRVIVIPATRCIPMPAGMEEAAAEFRYSLAPSPSQTHLWGAPLSLATDGATEAAYLELMTEGKPKLVAFKADGTAVLFSFPTGAPALDVEKIVVWKNGTIVSTGVTKAVTGLTFAAAPTSGDEIVAFYETA